MSSGRRTFGEFGPTPRLPLTSYRLVPTEDCMLHIPEPTQQAPNPEMKEEPVTPFFARVSEEVTMAVREGSLQPVLSFREVPVLPIKEDEEESYEDTGYGSADRGGFGAHPKMKQSDAGGCMAHSTPRPSSRERRYVDETNICPTRLRPGSYRTN